jgi:hypothetical protein
LTEISKENAQLKIDLAIYGQEDENGDQLVITLP